MTDTIPTLATYDEAALDAAFAAVFAELDAAAPLTSEELEAFRLHWLGRKQGRLKLISEAWIGTAPADAKRALGIRFNQLKQAVEQKKVVEQFLQSEIRTTSEPDFDLTLPGSIQQPGVPHPLLETMHAIVRVFQALGYSTQTGPEVETDFHNFEALNFPQNHPTQDTLQIAGQQHKPARERLLMRTHTSPVQIRTMLQQAPPLRIVIPGKVHRNDASDATHSPVFHQIEGLCVDTDITFSDLKGTLDHAMKALFGSDVKTRFFPSFFPFTEPSADVQISCIFCGGKGCRKCKHSGWIELLGCGMVDPAVFAAVDRERIAQGKEPAYDTARIGRPISGFAFGLGVDRIAMALHGVSDIGLFYTGDLRFLEQFA
jgi:phenylalanyl-tRNA synthetase alpha chain